MTCIWTREQMPGDTTAFLIKEFNEYHELTKLTEFKLYDRQKAHWFEVKDGNMTVGYDVDDGTVIYLYRGKLDGSEGDITSEYVKVKHENYPQQDSHTVLGMAHGDLRRIVAKLNFVAKDLWESRVVLKCDHEDMRTTINDVEVGVHYKTDSFQIVGAMGYPLEMKLKVGDDNYRLSTDWGNSFVILKYVKDSKIDETVPVDELILPGDHPALRFIKHVEED